MKIEWLSEAQGEFRELLNYYQTTVGAKYARAFSERILSSVEQLEQFPMLGVLKEHTLMGKYGFRALHIKQYVCIYRIHNDMVLIYHLVDGRSNYIYHIFGLE